MGKSWSSMESIDMKNQRPTPPSNRLLSLIFGEGAHVCGAPIDELTLAPASPTGVTSLLEDNGNDNCIDCNQH
jgi:hypothetical protein